MAPIFKNMKLAKQVFDEFKKSAQWFQEDATANPDFYKGLPIDIRDARTLPFILHFGNNKYETKEAYLEEMHTCINFLKVNKEAIFNIVYRVYEEYDCSNPDTLTEQGIRDAFAYQAFTQGFSDIMERNPEYFQNRYGKNAEQQRKHDALLIRSINLATDWQDEFTPEGISIANCEYMDADRKAGMMQQLNDRSEFDNEITAMKTKLRNSIADAFLGRSDAIELELPEVFGYLDQIEANRLDKNAACPKWFRKADYAEILKGFAEAVANPFTYSSKVSEAVLGDRFGLTNVYIDGKRLTEGKSMEQLSSRDTQRELTFRFAKAIQEGKIIEVANTYDVNGTLVHKLTPVRFTLSKDLKEHYKEEYCRAHNIGFFHRNFFDWGPWKIDPKTEDIFNKEYNGQKPEEKVIRQTAILHEREENMPSEYNKKKIELVMAKKAKDRADAKMLAERKAQKAIIKDNLDVEQEFGPAADAFAESEEEQRRVAAIKERIQKEDAERHAILDAQKDRKKIVIEEDEKSESSDSEFDEEEEAIKSVEAEEKKQ